jgi:hypothetical protein
MKSSYLATAALLFLSGCSSVQGGAPLTSDTPPGASNAEPLVSSYFSVLENDVPAKHRSTVAAALLMVDNTLSNEAFLERVQRKADWTFLVPPATAAGVSVSLRRKVDVGDGSEVRPRVVFYNPPSWGEDVCGGWHWGPFRQSISTGCTTRDGVIRRSISKMQDDPADMAEFLVHEWMHAAGFGHGDNDHQESREKRNSVPIHVACLAVAFPDDTEMAKCAQELLPDSAPASI